ncbi:hypothetical protein AB0E59_11025 [Lentzea sp. NPDC034063]|uniref:hypothetical protein n=1 Tax=unclassified Lentzea TaxID=2643253 RepID=UPI0033F844EF
MTASDEGSFIRASRLGRAGHGKPVIALAGTIATAAELLTDAAERTLRLVLVGAALT